MLLYNIFMIYFVIYFLKIFFIYIFLLFLLFILKCVEDSELVFDVVVWLYFVKLKIEVVFV